MTKNISNTKNMTSAELSDEILHITYKVPTDVMATRRVARLVRALRNSAGGRLPHCYGKSYCGLLSCPRCRGREQRVFMLKMPSIVAEYGGSDKWYAATILPKFGITRVGELPNGDLRGFKDQVRAAFRRVAPEAKAAMCVDISLEKMTGEKPYWQWHVHGLVSNLRPCASARLCKRFSWGTKDSSNPSCSHPVEIKKIDDLLGWLAYTSKPQFRTRSRWRDQQGNLMSDKKNMTAKQELNFVKALLKFQAKQQFFYIGMDDL